MRMTGLSMTDSIVVASASGGAFVAARYLTLVWRLSKTRRIWRAGIGDADRAHLCLSDGFTERRADGMDTGGASLSRTTAVIRHTGSMP